MNSFYGLRGNLDDVMYTYILHKDLGVSVFGGTRLFSILYNIVIMRFENEV